MTKHIVQPLVKLESHIRTPVGVPDTLFPTQLPDSMPGKAAADDPN